PEIRETILGRAQVRQIFVISKLGPIAGSYVSEGKIVRGAKVRVRRGDEVIGQGVVTSLKRFKDDVREVPNGQECGIGVEAVPGIQAGDVLEGFSTEEGARTRWRGARGGPWPRAWRWEWWSCTCRTLIR